MSEREKRSINKSHGKYRDIREVIRRELQVQNGVFWKIKYNLAASLSAQYGLEIGEVNHLIEQEARRMCVR